MFYRHKKLNKLYNSKLGYEEKYYVDEYDRGIIDVGAEHYDDLFSYYDMDGKSVLDKEFVEFIEMKADAIPLNKDLTLCFHVPQSSEEKRLEIEKTLKDTYIKQSYAINRKIKDNNKFSLSMLVVGLLFFIPFAILNNFLEAYPFLVYIQMFTEICTWIFIWEAVDSYFLCRRDLQDELLIKYRFIQARITIKEYYHIKDKKIFSNNAKTLSNMIHKNINETKEENSQYNLNNDI